MDGLLVLTKACLLILNVNKGREGEFLNVRAHEVHLPGQGVKLDDNSEGLPGIFIF